MSNTTLSLYLTLFVMNYLFIIYTTVYFVLVGRKKNILILKLTIVLI